MDFGVEAAGGHVIFSNDIMADACKTLEKYFPGADIRNVDISGIQAFPDADIVVGGYPCQSFSMAGNRNPEKDERTNLYKQFLRVVSVVRPKYFVAENVSGLKALSNGTFLKKQLEAFGESGYNVTYKLLNAKDYGVPQSRKRLFIVGIRKDLNQTFEFPKETHGKATKASGPLLPYACDAHQLWRADSRRPGDHRANLGQLDHRGCRHVHPQEHRARRNHCGALEGHRRVPADGGADDRCR